MKRNKTIFIAIFLIVLSVKPLFSQEKKGYLIERTNEKINLDGVLDELTWQNAEKATGFDQVFPSDTIAAKTETEIMLTYDDEFIYFAAKMYNLSDTREYVTPSLRRDYRGASIDGISFIFDTFGDNTNAFQFGINSFGVQREGLVVNGGYRSTDFQLSWDNKWYATSKKENGYWIAEGAIPFKTLRFKEGSPSWNVNFYRIDSETTERTSWTHIPRNFEIFNLAYMGKLIWDKPLEKPGGNISLIPYLATNVNRDFDPASPKPKSKSISGGLDAKIGIGPSLNLDLTVNPDFSQVEVDEQVTNLNRFELSFPEKRQFFIENADLFGSFGHPLLANPFFSRRIGIAYDSALQQNIQNKIHYGARLSGKLNNNWRIGLLNVQAAEDTSVNLPSLNYTVAAVQRKIFSRSNIGAILVNRQELRNTNDDFSLKPETYNRILGLDYVLSSADNKWNGKVFYHRSFDEDNTDDGQYSFASWLLYRSQTWEFDLAAVSIGENFDAPAGYLPRQGLFRVNPSLGYNIYPKRGGINSHKFTIETEQFWSANIQTDKDFKFTYNMSKSNTSKLEATLVQSSINLIKDFDPTRTGGVELAAGTGYTFRYFTFNYITNSRNNIVATLIGSAGSFYNGYRFNLGTQLAMRAQPYTAVKLNANFNRVVLPGPYSTANLFLIGPRIDLTFTKSLFFTTFIQYNSQIDNVNINARIQWRFKPVSDLFIVYTNNYGTEDQFGNYNLLEKNRALTIKLTYWLNL